MTSLNDFVDFAVQFVVPSLAVMTFLGILFSVTSWSFIRSGRVRSAATRHALWWLVIVCPVLLPLIVATVPKLHVVPNWTAHIDETTEASFAATSHPKIGSHTAADINIVSPVDATDQTQREPIASIQPPSYSLWVNRRGVYQVLLLIWCIGTVICIALILLGWISLYQTRRNATKVVDRRLLQMMRNTCKQTGVRTAPRFVLSDRRLVPMQWGILCPTVLLPVEAVGWSEAQLCSVLSHELIHLRRRDCASNLIAEFARAFCWFNPFVLAAHRRLKEACEQACDEASIRVGCNACDYAEALLYVSARSRQSRLPFGLAAEMASDKSFLEQRVRGILALPRRRGGQSVGFLASVAISFLAFTLVCGTLRMKQAAATMAVVETDSDEQESVSQLSTLASGPEDSLLRLSHVGDTADGFRSIAGSGHAVQFDREPDADHLVAVEIFGSRYGNEQPPAEDFHVYLLDEHRRVIAAFPFAYDKIQRGTKRWYTLPIRSTQIPDRFFVAVAFNPHRTKGIYLGFNDVTEASNSYVGRPTSGFVPIGDKREWMIRAVVTGSKPLNNPFESGSSISPFTVKKNSDD